MSKQTIVVTVIIFYILIRSLFIEPNSIKITKYTVETDYAGLNGIKVAFLSDLHLKKSDYKRLNKIVKLTNKENVNILLLGGDYAKYPNNSKNMNIDLVASKLNLIKSEKKFAVLGDDDVVANYKGTIEAFEKNRIHVVENSAIRTIVNNRYIDIIGISTKDANVTKAMRRTMMPRIVVSHNPDIYYDIMDDVSLILAGHTHGGQVVIPMTPPMFVPSRYGGQFASGMQKPKDNTIIISKGLGTDKIPLRLNCNPEIVIVNFVKKQ